MEDESKLKGFHIQERGKVRLDWKRPNGSVYYTRCALSKVHAKLSQMFLLNCLNMPIGTHVYFEHGRIVSSNNFGIVGSGRKPNGKRAMTGAERTAAYRKRLSDG